MSGPDTIRGFNFQHATALHAALDLLDDAASERIEIEGDDDVIDFQVLGAKDVRRRVAQVKSRNSSIGPQEIINVVERWRGLPSSDGAEFDYITDAHLGRDAATKLVPAIERLTDGQPLEDKQAAYLLTKGLASDHALLARVRVTSRHPPVGALLAQAEMRVLNVLGSHRAVSPDDAKAIVDRLFRVIATAAGEGEGNLRRVTREEVAEIIGVDLASINAGAGWSAERAEEYRNAILGQPRDPAAVELGLDVVGPDAALSVVEGAASSSLAEPASQASDLLDEARGAGLTGRSGSGKTTALKELAAEACRRGLVPILPDLVAYQAGSLRRLLHQQLEAQLPGPLGPRGLDAVLASKDVVVLADAVSERPAEEASHLLRDLAVLRRGWPVRVIAGGRRSFQLRSSSSPVYELRGLDWEARERVAVALIADGANAARELADRLGNAAEVPLLFRMGLSLLSEGRDARSVEQLYGEFIGGLAARAGVARPDAPLAAAGRCCLELVADERFDADAYWWRASMRQALDDLSAGGVFEVGELSAEAAIAALVEIGLLYERGAAAQIGFLHDSFRDYLAARTLIEGHAQLPEPLDERYEQVADLVAQGTSAATVELLVRLCDNPAAAASAAELDLDIHEPSQEVTQRLLRQLLGAYSFPSAPLPAKVGLSQWAGDERYYLAVHEGDGRARKSADEFEEAIVGALLIAAYTERPTTLRVAVNAWQELLRQELRRAGHSGRPLPIPAEAEELAAAIAEHFAATRAAVADLAEGLCPALSERIVETVGWHGLDGHLQPTGRADRPRGRLVHRFVYTHDCETVTVDLDESDEASALDFRGGSQTIAEEFLREAPESKASAAVAGALKKILATWGP